MKVDLYNNHEAFIKESKQDWTVSKWLRTKGINLDDLDNHPQMSDVITLIHIRDNFWHRMNSHEQAVWGGYWSIVYKQEFPLNKKFWNKFDNIVKAIDQRELIMAQQRLRVQQLRKQTQNHSNNTELNDKANRSVPAQSKLHEKGQTGVLLSADLLT